MGLLRKLIDTEYKELKRFEAIADKVMALDEDMQKLSDDELKAKTEEFKNRLNNGETVLLDGKKPIDSFDFYYVDNMLIFNNNGYPDSEEYYLYN